MYSKINKLAVVLSLFAGLLVTANVAYSQAQADSTALTGIVVDSETERPVSGIELTIEGTNTTTTTNEKGEFTFEGVGAGTYTIVASPEGYEEVSKEVEFNAKDTESTLVIELTPSK